MKRKKFIQLLERQGCYLLRHGSRHDIYINPATGQRQPVPRHPDIDEMLVKHIKKHLGIN
ncbi:type II toxin-antitoxin system HicA family toxin [Ectothiorhodospiraceae bacterium BW-2]|nr:type II toxin-antitoxin system HicA family toxin [Ectothiorhodospiraceae bacterium BW-2]